MSEETETEKKINGLFLKPNTEENKPKREKRKSTQLELLERARLIPDEDVTEINQYKYEVESNDKRNQGEIKYIVTFVTEDYKIAQCTCPNYTYTDKDKNPEYQCKHIIKVIDMVLRLANKKD